MESNVTTSVQTSKSKTNNVYYGVCVGKVYEPPIKIINEGLSLNLRAVVSRLCPPGTATKVTSFHMSDSVPLTLAHTNIVGNVEYYVTRSDERKMDLLLRKDTGVDVDIPQTNVDVKSNEETCDTFEE